MAISDEIPKSRITLTYRTDVSGEKEERDLPFRLLVTGDLSLDAPKGGATTNSNDRALDLDQRKLRDLNGTNLDEVMADLGTTISFKVPNKIQKGGDDIEVNLKLDSMRSFSPDSIVNNVTELKSLVLLRKLLLECQSSLDNRKEFRNMIRELNAARRSGDAAASEAVTKILSELESNGDFKSFKLPSRNDAAGDDAGSSDAE